MQFLFACFMDIILVVLHKQGIIWTDKSVFYLINIYSHFLYFSERLVIYSEMSHLHASLESLEWKRKSRHINWRNNWSPANAVTSGAMNDSYGITIRECGHVWNMWWDWGWDWGCAHTIAWYTSTITSNRQYENHVSIYLTVDSMSSH